MPSTNDTSMKDSLEVAGIIDHTLLQPDATDSDIQRLCDEAGEYGFFSVCVHPYFVPTARDMLSGTDVRVTTVVGFPLGMNMGRVKVFEAMEAVSMGADELDIVVNIGECKSHRWERIQAEIADVVSATPDVIHKIILETYYLTDEEKRTLSIAVREAGAEYIKTSTGFAPAGAVLRDMEIIRTATQGEIGIKAAGGIRTLEDVLRFVASGATRIGTSSGVAILREVQGLEKSEKNC